MTPTGKTTRGAKHTLSSKLNRIKAASRKEERDALVDEAQVMARELYDKAKALQVENDRLVKALESIGKLARAASAKDA